MRSNIFHWWEIWRARYEFNLNLGSCCFHDHSGGQRKLHSSQSVSEERVLVRAIVTRQNHLLCIRWRFSCRNHFVIFYERFSSTSYRSRRPVVKVPISISVRGLCICSLFGPLSPFYTEQKNVYPEFECWMFEGIVAVTVSSVRYVYICYR